MSIFKQVPEEGPRFSLKRVQFIYGPDDHPIIFVAPLKHNIYLGNVTEYRAYLWRGSEGKYYHILFEEHEDDRRILTCVEASMLDILAIKNMLFPEQKEEA